MVEEKPTSPSLDLSNPLARNSSASAGIPPRVRKSVIQVLSEWYMFVGRFMCGTPVHATGSPASGKIASAPRCVSTCSM